MFEELDSWIRHKIRGILWRHVEEAPDSKSGLKALQLKEHTARKWAYSSKGPWRMAKTYGMHRAVSNGVIEEMGYTSMMSIIQARSQ